jgi:2,5-diamino-6-(ribosylamino)-4(3H)-pyrimidinone 5'-phosphate reductase
VLPEVVIHNSASLDSSLTGFEVNMQLHYEIAGTFKADMHLVGSNTARTGINMFFEEIPKESAEDFKKPDKEGMLWAIPDSTGKLKGLLHVLRQSEYCKDVVMFVSQNTPKDYINYLEERDYDFHTVGKDKCDLETSLNLLYREYYAKTILTDTGSILGNILLEKRLVSRISLLIHPVIVGACSNAMFGNISNDLKLNLTRRKFFEEGYVWLVYKVLN